MPAKWLWKSAWSLWACLDACSGQLGILFSKQVWVNTLTQWEQWSRTVTEASMLVKRSHTESSDRNEILNVASQSTVSCHSHPCTSLHCICSSCMISDDYSSTQHLPNRRRGPRLKVHWAANNSASALEWNVFSFARVNLCSSLLWCLRSNIPTYCWLCGHRIRSIEWSTDEFCKWRRWHRSESKSVAKVLIVWICEWDFMLQQCSSLDVIVCKHRLMLSVT